MKVVNSDIKNIRFFPATKDASHQNYKLTFTMPLLTYIWVFKSPFPILLGWNKLILFSWSEVREQKALREKTKNY